MEEAYSPPSSVRFIGKKPIRAEGEVPHIYKGIPFVAPLYIAKVPLRLAQEAIMRWPDLYEFVDSDDATVSKEIEKLHTLVQSQAEEIRHLTRLLPPEEREKQKYGQRGKSPKKYKRHFGKGHKIEMINPDSIDEDGQT